MSNLEHQEKLAFNLKQKAKLYLSQGKLDAVYAPIYDLLLQR